MIDAHIHLFPDRMFDAIWKWFDDHAWTVKHKIYADEIIDRLEAMGVTHAVALPYAHKPGMSVELNAWLGDLARRRPMVIPGATAHPRDADIRGILKRAAEVHGARIVKQHCHVLGIAPDDPAMFPIYEACISLGLPLVLHAGNGPRLTGYNSSTDGVSGAAHTVPVLDRYPELRLIVPHLGCMEEEIFFGLLERFPNLYLDTTMVMVASIPELQIGDRSALARFPGRILYGTDFPNIPYEPGTERLAIEALGLDPEVFVEITHNAAARLLGLPKIQVEGLF